jgi:hypothetical protein
MLSYQQRVVEELQQLDERRKNLMPFFHTDFFKTLPQEEQSRLSRQSLVMEEYSNILKERIDSFPRDAMQT